MQTAAHDALLAELTALERALHYAGEACPPQRLDVLLHPDFWEVGQSGRTWTRAQVVAWLTQQPHASPAEAGDFVLTLLAPAAALLTYRSWHPARAGGRAVHRASLWLQGDGGWRLRYHQGTPATP